MNLISFSIWITLEPRKGKELAHSQKGVSGKGGTQTQSSDPLASCRGSGSVFKGLDERRETQPITRLLVLSPYSLQL